MSAGSLGVGSPFIASATPVTVLTPRVHTQLTAAVTSHQRSLFCSEWRPGQKVVTG